MNTHKMRETALLTADVVVLAWHDDMLHVLLIGRRKPPFQSMWALPGGHLDPGESFEQAARRELAEETGITVDADLIPVGVYSAPGRDPRGRYVSTAYVAVLDEMPTPIAGDDATTAGWLPIYAPTVAGQAPPAAEPVEYQRVYTCGRLAFDHHQILDDAVATVFDVVFGKRP